MTEGGKAEPPDGAPSAPPGKPVTGLSTRGNAVRSKFSSSSIQQGPTIRAPTPQAKPPHSVKSASVMMMKKKSVFATTLAKKFGVAWKGVATSRHPDQLAWPGGSPYKAWLDDLDETEPEPPPKFRTLPHPPVKAPLHPSRLELLRKTSGSIDPASGDLWSKACVEVLTEQNTIKPFDAFTHYRKSAFFSHCCPTFLRELLTLGGEQARRGLHYDSGDVVYTEGEVGTSLFIIVRGVAALSHEADVRRPATASTQATLFSSSTPPTTPGAIKTELFHEGCHFGEGQLLGVVLRRQGTMRANTSLHLLEVQSSHLSELLRRHAKDRPDKDGQRRFGEQRRYFEQEAVRLYRERISDDYGGLVRTPRSQRTTQDSSPSHSEARLMTPRTNERRSSSSVTPRSQADPRPSSLGAPPRLSERRSSHKGQSSSSRESVRPSASRESSRVTGSASRDDAAQPAFLKIEKYVSGAIDPAAWRRSVEVGQVELLGDPMCSAGLAQQRDRLSDKLVSSLRGDLRSGYMMPADVLGTSESRRRRSEKGIDFLGAARMGSMGAETGESPTLEVQLLPPLEHMSPVQKQGLLRQLQRISEIRRRKIAAAVHLPISRESESPRLSQDEYALSDFGDVFDS